MTITASNTHGDLYNLGLFSHLGHHDGKIKRQFSKSILVEERLNKTFAAQFQKKKKKSILHSLLLHLSKMASKESRFTLIIYFLD